jgi:thiol-disulfide isomerase/thioredoxin
MKRKGLIVFSSLFIIISLITVFLFPLTYKGSEKIILIENDNLKNLDDILRLKCFNNKVVIVDVWGTYCDPCLKEFEYMDTLKKVFINQPVEFLYLCSGVRIDHKIKWKRIIKDEKLKGYHVLINSNIFMEIWDKLKIENQYKYLIPHYFIVKDDKILVNDAFRPSSKEKLYFQINEILNQK